MKDKNRMAAAIASLIRKTQDGHLEWRRSSPTNDLLIPPSEAVVETLYLANEGDRLIRLYSYRTKVWPEEDLWFWEESVGLELSDESKKSWWRFPGHPAISDLLEAVRYKTVAVDEFLEKLVSE